MERNDIRSCSATHHPITIPLHPVYSLARTATVSDRTPMNAPSAPSGPSEINENASTGVTSLSTIHCGSRNRLNCSGVCRKASL